MDIIMGISQWSFRTGTSVRVGGVVLSWSPNFAAGKDSDSGFRIDELAKTPGPDGFALFHFVLDLQLMKVVNIVFIKV